MGNRVRQNLGILLLVWLAPLSTTAAADCKPWAARIVSVQGEIEVKQASTSNWHPVNRNDTFCPGDSIRVGNNSRAAIVLTNETLLRLDQNSAIKLTQFETELPSILEFIMGIGHFISRVPRSLKIETATVNAAIEGTEFVVSVSADETSVTVFEGTVLTQNQKGEMRITDGETVIAKANTAPLKTLLAKPRNTVQWALYFPPVIEMDNSSLSKASQLLSVGRVNEAESLLQGMDSGEALAMQAIIAIVNNEQERAFKLATGAVQQTPQSAATHIAMSYAWQAKLDLKQALASALQAVKYEPSNAIAWARLAELQLSTGELNKALASAQQATQHNANLSRTQTILGYAYLVRIDIDEAMAAFHRAIELDQVDPLPHLGLGLARIRKNHLTEGRREIEIAASLDPNNALLRSYMGKAYYEEKRNGLASEQFTMAKALDPSDPTAWFYDSVLLQSDNRPVEALQAQLQAIELNDNRGVYRSRQLLDQDDAARSVALGRIYNDLNFEQQARYQATRSLAQDPGNHSAHRLLADSYSGITNLDAARQSELLKSKMTQPLNLDPLQPQLSNSNLGLLDGNGPGELSYNEYNPLFIRNGFAIQLDATIGEKNTWSNDAIVAGLYDRFAFSLGQYHTQTDGFRTNAEYEQDIYNVFTQYALSNNTSFQIEVSDSAEQKGDVTQRLLPEFLNNNNIQIHSEISTVRLGIKQALTTDTDLLISGIRRDQDFSSTDNDDPSLLVRTDKEKKIDLYEAQITGKRKQTAWLTGVSYQSENEESSTEFVYTIPCPLPLPSCVLPTEVEKSQTRLYGYLYYDYNKSLALTGGLTLIKENNEPNDKLKKLYPKVGLQLKPTAVSEIRLAAFRNRVSVILPSLYETLEPTQIVGFNQLPDDLDLTDSWNYAVAYNHRFSQNLHAGVSSIYRKMETKLEIQDISAIPPSRSIQTIEYDDTHADFWLNWTPALHWALGIEYSYNRYNLEKGAQATDTGILVPDGILKLETHKVPTSISFFHPSGFSSKLTATYFDQEGNFIDNTGFATQQGEDRGLITDFVFSYRLSKRYGSVSLGVNNLFDKRMNFEDRNSYDASNPVNSAFPSAFSIERVVFGTISLNFR